MNEFHVFDVGRGSYGESKLANLGAGKEEKEASWRKRSTARLKKNRY